VKLESQVWIGKYGDENNCVKTDNTLKSVAFTLKNPNNVAPKRFGLKPERNNQTIWSDFNWRPCFHNSFGISDNCNVNHGNYT
jgi:hypothetical protein